MTLRPTNALPIVSPRGSRTAVPGDRSRTASLRRELLLLALVATALAGPLGRPASDEGASDEIFRPLTVTSAVAVTP